MPEMTEHDARRATAAILAMRVGNQQKQQLIYQDGNLKLHRRPMAYKGLSRAWLRNYANAKDAEGLDKKSEDDRRA